MFWYPPAVGEGAGRLRNVSTLFTHRSALPHTPAEVAGKEAAWARVRAAAFRGVNRAVFFTTDVTPAPVMHEQFKVEPGAHDILPKQPGLGLATSNRTAQMYSRWKYIRRAEDSNHDTLSAQARKSACLPPAGAADCSISRRSLRKLPVPFHRRYAGNGCSWIHLSASEAPLQTGGRSPRRRALSDGVFARLTISSETGRSAPYARLRSRFATIFISQTGCLSSRDAEVSGWVSGVRITFSFIPLQ